MVKTSGVGLKGKERGEFPLLYLKALKFSWAITTADSQPESVRVTCRRPRQQCQDLLPTALQWGKGGEN